MTRPGLSRWKPAVLLAQAGLLALVGGCAPNVPQSTIAPRSDYAVEIINIYSLIFILSVIVFVLVEGALVYTMFRFRAKPNDPLPKQVHGSTKLEIAWTIAPAIILVVIGVPSLQLVFAHVDTPPEANALHVTVTGHQWWFQTNYPDLNITTANEIHVQANRQVVFTVKSNDVIHSFWVPQMGGKMDMIPIHENKQIYTPNEVGEYLGQCAELCGVAHANMRFRLIVDSPADFDAWTKRMQTAAQPNVDPAFQAWAQRTQPQGPALSDKIQAGQQAFMGNACVGCHTISGTSAAGVTGPNLSRLGERTTIAAGIRQNDIDHLKEWIKDPQTLKPGNLMPTLDLPPDTVDAIATYLESLCDPGHCAGQVNTANATGTTTAGASH